MSMCRVLCCWKRVLAMTSVLPWQNSIGLCPTSFHTPRPNLPLSPGVPWLPTFAFPSPVMIKVKETQVRQYVLREGIREQTHWNHNHRKLANLITWTTALSNSMKLSHAMWGHLKRGCHGGEIWQNVAHCRREWQTTSVFLLWEPQEQYEKAKWLDTERGTPQVGRCTICYWRSVEK